jgi:hypothetical protein
LVIEAVAAENHILHILYYIISQISPVFLGTAHDSPGLAAESLVGCEVPAALIPIVTKVVWFLKVHIEAIADTIMVLHINLRPVKVKRRQLI